MMFGYDNQRACAWDGFATLRPFDGRDCASAIFTLLTVSAAHAAGSGMPWERRSSAFSNPLQGRSQRS